jgi:hypothetical protein
VAFCVGLEDILRNPFKPQTVSGRPFRNRARQEDCDKLSMMKWLDDRWPLVCHDQVLVGLNFGRLGHAVVTIDSASQSSHGKVEAGEDGQCATRAWQPDEMDIIEPWWICGYNR